MARLPVEIDTVLICVGGTNTESLSQVLDEANTAIIAIATYESPTALKAIYDLNAHADMNKSIRPLGVLSQFTLARYRHRTEARMSAWVHKHEDTPRGRRLLDKTVRPIVDVLGMEEDAAYRLLREQTTPERVRLLKKSSSRRK